MTEPRLMTAIALLAIGIISGGIARMVDNGGVKFILQGLCYLFLFAGILQLFNNIAYHGAQRLREFNMARVLHITQVANAVQHLTTGRQLELVESIGLVTMSLVPGEQEPILFVDVPGGRVPHEAVQDFLRQSQDTAPALMPIRRGGQPWREAQLITALLVAHGWAEKGSGPHAARLVVPLEQVAAALWVDLDVEEL